MTEFIKKKEVKKNQGRDYKVLLAKFYESVAKNEDAAIQAFGDSLAAIREIWEPETTARNLRLIRKAREKRNEIIQWSDEIELELEKRAKK